MKTPEKTDVDQRQPIENLSLVDVFMVDVNQ